MIGTFLYVALVLHIKNQQFQLRRLSNAEISKTLDIAI